MHFKIVVTVGDLRSVHCFFTFLLSLISHSCCSLNMKLQSVGLTWQKVSKSTNTHHKNVTLHFTLQVYVRIKLKR